MVLGTIIRVGIKVLVKVGKKTGKYVGPIVAAEVARRLKNREATLQRKLAKLEKMKKKGKITHTEYVAMRKKLVERFPVEDI
ncbi:hypothetical protein LCGC14_3108090 [marine sediment metagenome]|uniref:Uncharacterized protein n=1 Tax=marine sediment metagenome TaxID=412755 RepID=A0A0F8WUM9_9ZZZZ